jgi:transcription initiation factor TFIIE subunit alpha
MRIAKEILQKTAAEAVGEDAVELVEYLKGKENVSEFKIAKDLKEDIHRVRNILYRLNSMHLSTYIRKKDRQKGWYISYWTLNDRRFKEVYGQLQEKRLEQLKEKLKKEQEYRDGLYICPNLCTRMNFESAMELNFTCPECGRILNPQDNSRTIEHLRSMIEEMETTSA